eukprot:12744285-Alexandrium_andersonii.AAC.1
MASRVGPLPPCAGSATGRSAGDGGGMSSGATPTALRLNSGHGSPAVRSERLAISRRPRFSASKSTSCSRHTPPPTLRQSARWCWSRG